MLVDFDDYIVIVCFAETTGLLIEDDFGLVQIPLCRCALNFKIEMISAVLMMAS